MINVHNLIKSLALVSLTPVSAYSLGIGDIKLHSALNQSLNAEISLILSKTDKASDIKVNLAPPDKFDESGVPWTSFLSKIKFETVVGANNTVIIRISSKEAVKEPFLDFLLQVNWPKGSLYREFTVLLDPPVEYQMSSSSTDYNAEPVKSTQPQQSPKQATRQKTVKVSGNSANEYGPTNKNDTLWRIAKIARQNASFKEDISVEQMLIALYKKNPSAFYKDNVNALLPKKTLTIPTIDAIRKLSHSEALAEFTKQAKDWRNPKDTESDSSKVVTKESPVNQLKLVAPAEKEVAKSVQVVAPENKPEETVSSPNEPAKALDKEVVSPTPAINNNLEDRMAILEKQLAMMQQIIVLKDQQLATLQGQVQVKSSVPVDPPKVEPVLSIPKPPVQIVAEETSSSYASFIWGGLSVVLLTLLAGFLWRKRKQDELRYGDSFFNPISSDIDNDIEDTSEEISKNSSLKEQVIADYPILEDDLMEIDPIIEADLYISYGRFQQAESLMRDAIKEYPARDEYKLKLLRIFYLTKNKQAFDAYSSELAKADNNDDSDFWLSVNQLKNEFPKDSINSVKDVVVSKQETVPPKDNKIELTLVPIDKRDSDELEAELNKPKLSTEMGSFDSNMIKEPLVNLQTELTIKASNPLEGNSEEDHISILDFQPNTPHENNSQKVDFIKPNPSGIKTDSTPEYFELETPLQDINNLESYDIDITALKNNLDNQVLPEQHLKLDEVFTDNSLEKDLYADNFLQNDVDQQESYNASVDIETKLDLLKAYITMKDQEAAEATAKEIYDEGTIEQRKIVEILLKDVF
jgi:pilus assembly protein FimV